MKDSVDGLGYTRFARASLSLTESAERKRRAAAIDTVNVKKIQNRRGTDMSRRYIEHPPCKYPAPFNMSELPPSKPDGEFTKDARDPTFLHIQFAHNSTLQHLPLFVLRIHADFCDLHPSSDSKREHISSGINNHDGGPLERSYFDFRGSVTCDACNDFMGESCLEVRYNGTDRARAW
jgi:hypothetical protein